MRKCWLILLLFLPNLMQGQIITSIAGGGASLGDGGPATAAQVTLPFSGGFDTAGNYYFAQASGATRIRKITPVGIITTVAGNGVPGYSGDGLLATVAQIRPQGIAVDKMGNIFIADYYNNRLRKVDVATGIINTIAGNGTPTSTGDGGPATDATIVPSDLCLDTIGNLYIMDGARIRKINTAGIITTIAGNGTTGFSGDGFPATDAQITVAYGICFDASGNLYIATNSGTRIRKIDMSTGIITTIAGTGVYLYTGDGMPATAAQFKCFGLKFNSVGNLFIADYGNQRIRMIDGSGIIHTVVGTGVAGFLGDGGMATAAQIYSPEGIALDACDNLYIADDANNRIRKVAFNTLTVPTITITGITTASVSTTVTVNATITGAGSSYAIRWFKNSALFSTTTIPTFTYTKAAGTDTITARVVPASTGCYDSTLSAPHIITVSTVAVQNIHPPTEGTLTLYPNPAQNTITLSNAGEIIDVAIFDLVGKLLLNKECNTNNPQLDISTLPTGIYLLIATDNTGRKWVAKFNKQ